MRIRNGATHRPPSRPEFEGRAANQEFELGAPSTELSAVQRQGGRMLQELALRALVAIKMLEASTKDEDGQTLAEYGLIMAVIAVAVVVAAVVAFRGAIVSAFSSATNCLDGSC
jgi:Flp pilus assembly pilin Flp